jgi:hypothetical protein
LTTEAQSKLEIFGGTEFIVQMGAMSDEHDGFSNDVLLCDAILAKNGKLSTGRRLESG